MKPYLILAAIALLVATVWGLKPGPGGQPALQPLVPTLTSKEVEMKKLAKEICSELEAQQVSVENFFLKETGLRPQVPVGIAFRPVRNLIDLNRLSVDDLRRYFYCLDRWWKVSLFLGNSENLEMQERLVIATRILEDPDSFKQDARWREIFHPISVRRTEVEEAISNIMFR